MTNYDNEAAVEVSRQHADDDPITIRVQQVGDGLRGGAFPQHRARYAYEVHHNGKVVLSGDGVCGPAIGVDPEAEAVAYAVAGFLSAGTQGEFRDSYDAATLAWLDEHGERLGNFSAERDQ